MRKAALTLIPVFLMVFLFISPAAAEEITLKPRYTVELATIIPAVGPAADLLEELRQELFESTGGRMKLVIYTGGVMGDEPDIVRKMRLGQIHGGIMMTLVGMGIICPETKVLELPFLFNNFDEVDHVLAKTRTTFSRLFEEKNTYLVSWSEIGFGYFFFKNPVRSPRDLKKVKMVSYEGDPIFAEAVKAAGFKHLIPMQISETLYGLQTGMIDGAFGTLTSMIALQWPPRIRYFLKVPFAYSPGGTVVSKTYFDSLPPEMKEAFFDVLRNWEPLIVCLMRMMEDEVIAALPENGIEEVPEELTRDISREMRARTRSLYRSLAGKHYPPELLEEIQTLLKEYRGLRAIRPDLPKEIPGIKKRPSD